MDIHSQLPLLTQASAVLTLSIQAINEAGQKDQLQIPAERSLTVYVDKREIITLMTLGAQPELLTLGYLLNQNLIASAQEIESITVDWDVGSAAVKTRVGLKGLEERTAQRVVTSGCGQGSVFGSMMDLLADAPLPSVEAARISATGVHAVVEAIRLHPSIYKRAGSVHGCALFRGSEMLMFTEDVGRHNAIDTIAGWMAMNGLRPLEPSQADVFYTTGRLTSEMVIKAAQMGIAILISRSGITQMGFEIAQRLGMCVIGRAVNKRFLAYSGQERLVF